MIAQRALSYKLQCNAADDYELNFDGMIMIDSIRVVSNIGQHAGEL